MIGSEAERYLAKVCSALNSHGVDYIVVGGAAVSHYGYNRPSGIGDYKENLKVDLDFWYKPSIESYLKILDALDDLEVDTSELRNLVFDKDTTSSKFLIEIFIQIFSQLWKAWIPLRHQKVRLKLLILEESFCL